MEVPGHNGDSSAYARNGFTQAGFQGADGGDGSGVNQAAMQVNSLSLSERDPAALGARKRNREEEDHSFRVDKMNEAPSTVPRNQASLTPEQYMQQQQQHMQAFPMRDDSITYVFPMLLPHTNSNGSTGSTSFLNMFASQDSLSQDPQLMQQSSTPAPGADKPGVTAFNYSDQYPSGYMKPTFTMAGAAPNIGYSMVGVPNMNIGSTGMASQNSGISLPSQNSGLLSQSTSGLSLGPSNSGLNLGASGLSLGTSTSGLGMQQQNPNMSVNGAQNLLGLNLGGPTMPSLGLGLTGGMPMTNPGAFGGSFATPTFMNFAGGVARGPGFDYMGDGRRFDQTAGANGPVFFGFATPSQSADAFATASRLSPSGSTGSKPKRSSAGKSKASAAPISMHMNSADKYVTWSEEQEAALIDAVQELGTDDWESIAARIPGGNRSSAQCLRHWENKLSPNIKRGQWSPEEDEALRKLVERAAAQGLGLLDIPWDDIKECIPGRTLKQVRERWRSNLDPNIVRGEWTPYEDEMIIKMRDEQGMGWAAIARALKGRTEHSVKTRHRSMQRAKRRAWTEKEDRTIIEMVQAGTDFGTVANELKNRTAASVEIRWNELNGR